MNPSALCFRKIPIAKKFTDKKGRWKKEVSKFFVESYLSHSAEKFRRGTLLCFRKLRLSKSVRVKRGGWNHDFSSKLFCLRAPKLFVDEPFCAVFQKNSGSEKFTDKKGGRRKYQNFPSNFFVTVPENFVEKPFCVSENFG